MELTRTLRNAVTNIRQSPEMGVALEAMYARRAEFSSPIAATLAGIAAEPAARDYFNQQFDLWTQGVKLKDAKTAGVDELVIGAGVHAAIYCSVRVREGFEKPLVIEGANRAGGSMSYSQRAAFDLNRRNRPGGLSVPGRRGSLNVLPGAPVQPSDLSGGEYQRNIDLAFAVRTALGMSAKVRTGVRVTDIDNVAGATPRRYRAKLSNGLVIFADRIVAATGLGEPFGDTEGTNLLNFASFMRRMDNPFPLRGLNRVAVVGAGDSGKTVIEALTGQGPSTGWSVASLDYLEQIDWYGVDAEQSTREEWENCNRSRYKGIARLLPRTIGAPSIVSTFGKAEELAPGYDMAFVDDRPYDLVIDCRGYRSERIPNPFGSEIEYCPDGRAVGTWIPGEDLFTVGPACNLPVTAQEKKLNPQIAEVPENSTALFRYAGRTAALAGMLPVPKVERFKPSGRTRSFTKKTVQATGRIVLRDTATSDLTDMAEAVVEAARDNRETRVAVGNDKNGKPLRVGDFVIAAVPAIGLDPTRVQVLGNVDSRSDILAVTPPPGLTGGFTMNGRTVYGIDPQYVEIDTTMIPAPGAYTGLTDANETPLFVGDRVKVRESGRFGDVLGSVIRNEGGRLRVDLDLSTSSTLSAQGASAVRDAVASNAAADYTTSVGRVEKINPKNTKSPITKSPITVTFGDDPF